MASIRYRSFYSFSLLRTRRLRECLLISAIMAAAAPAFGQETADPTGTPTQASPQAPADQAAPPAGPAALSTLGEVVVTGSLIKNPALAGNAPVNVIGADEIKFRQANTAQSFLSELPGAVGSIGAAINSGNTGASTVNLYGLGSNRNLVLLDGNRVVPADLTGITDLDNIPLALVKRVEVLTGGAATTYGADAISGVVNFITRDDFSGVELSAGNQITQKGDGETYRVDLTLGGNFNDGKGNAVLSIGYQNANPVYQGDRSFSNTLVDSFTGKPSGSGTTVPARFNVAGAGLGTLQINPTTGTLVPTYAPFNYLPYDVFQTPFSRQNVFGSAHYDVSDDVTFYTRGMFTKNTVETTLPPSGASGLALTIPYSNPYLPAGMRAQICDAFSLTTAQCDAAAAARSPTDPNYRTFTATVYRRTPESGARDSTYTTNMFDYRVGVKGKISSNVHFDVSAAYGTSDNNDVITGFTQNSHFKNAALATNTSTCLGANPGCVPVDLFGGVGSITPAMVNYLVAPSFGYVKTTLSQINGLISGNLGYHTGWAQDNVNFAVGTDYRNYHGSEGADALANSGDLGGLSAIPTVNGGYGVTEGFGELVAPIVQDMRGVKSLSLNGGIRYSNYSVFTPGSPRFGTTTWKLGSVWAPTDAVKFRGVFQHAVRAPNIGELFTPVTISQAALSTDPCAGLAPATNANLRAVCVAQGAPASTIGTIGQPNGGLVNATSGGNPQLKPERSNSFTAGVVLQPKQWIQGVSATVDYYHINVTGAISAPSGADVFSGCFNNLTANSATSPACTAIHRNTIDGSLSGSGIAGIPIQLSNLGTYVTDGIDLGLQYRRDIGIFVLNASFDGNYTHRFDRQDTPTSYKHQCAGYYGLTCGGVDGSIQPKVSWNQRTTLTYHSVNVSLLWRHLGPVSQDPYDVAHVDGAAHPGFGHIGAYNYLDLSAQYRPISNLQFTVTVENLADNQPPIVGGDIGATTFNSGNTYPATYDALGRTFAVGVTLEF